MKLGCDTGEIRDLTAGCAVYFVAEFDRIADRKLQELDAASSGALTTLMASGEFTGKVGEVATIYHPEGYRADRIIITGLGNKKKITSDSYRKAAGYVSRNKGLTLSKKAIFYLGKTEREEYYQAAAEGFFLGSYTLLDFKTGEAAKDKKILNEISIVLDNKRVLSRLEKAVEHGLICAEGQNLVRTLASMPSNFLTPRKLAAKAQALAKAHRFTCKVLDEKAIAREKMGAFMAVAQGATEPPRFIILEYKGAAASRKPIVLVGKGVTFDTGGISLKPGLNMHEMKSDMSGAGAVLATLVMAARLKIKQNVVGLIPATENVPSATAIKPGDIVTSRKGVTVEIINTDAEGRLILADGLDYANKYKPQAVIDIATLTGAALIVLGYEGAPILGNSKALLSQIKKAGEATAERVWELPIWDEHRDLMKSSLADVVNSHGRPAGTITAGAFLENFIGDYPWAHVDIASVDNEHRGRAYLSKGFTGIGARMLTELLYRWKKV
jgi:leucyl aminopeptidase